MTTPTSTTPRKRHTTLGAESRTPREAPIAILYENREWMQDLFVALRDRGLRYEAFNLGNPQYLPDEPGEFALVINRVSPSARSRGNEDAVDIARRWIAEFERRGTPVINGSSFEIEMSKLAQHCIIRDLGLSVPRTAVLPDRGAVGRLAHDFRFPAVLKPDTGGSGVGVEFVRSRAHLERIADEAPEMFDDEGLLLLQEFITSRDGAVMRTELVDGDLLYAMRVTPLNTFNLCPADGCERPPIDGIGETGAIFEHVRDVPADVIAEARAIVRTAGLSVGGVEFIEGDDGTRYFYDINATSAYRADVSESSGVDAMDRLVSFIERKLHEVLPVQSPRLQAA